MHNSNIKGVVEMQAVKLKEVWRNPDGSFAKAPEPEIEEEPKKDKNPNAEMGALLLVITVGFLILAFWYITLPVIASIGAGHYANKYFKKERLIINRVYIKE